MGDIIQVKMKNLYRPAHSIRIKVICENCGKETFLSLKSRRKIDLCDECYEEYRKKDRHSTS